MPDRTTTSDNVSPPRPSSWMLPLLLALLVVGVQGAILWDFSIDDVGISWRYARHLADGHGLRWNLEGPSVEGYSNFLWVILIAIPGAFGMDIAVASKILGFALALANIALFAMVLRRLFSGYRLWWTPLLVVAVTPEWTAWSLSGLEIALFGFFLLLALGAFTLTSPRRGFVLAAACAGLTLTRPEGFVVAGFILGMWILLMRGESIGARWRMARLPLLSWLFTLAGLVGFRLWYFGYPLPNTVYAKFSTFLPSSGQVGQWMMFALPFIAAWVVVAALHRRHRFGHDLILPLAVAALCAAAHTLMILPVHPVMNFLHRYHVALLPYWLLALPPVMDWLARRRRRTALVAALALILWSAQGWPSVQRRYEVEMYQQRVQRCIVAALRELPGRPTIAIIDAGLIPYWSDLPTIDVWGLCDAEIARESSRQAAVMKRAPAVYITTVDTMVAGFERPRLGDDKLMYQSGNFSSVYQLWRPCNGGPRPSISCYDYAILVLARWARDNGVRIPERREFRGMTAARTSGRP